jgi:hypothetical protein
VLPVSWALVVCAALADGDGDARRQALIEVALTE